MIKNAVKIYKNRAQLRKDTDVMVDCMQYECCHEELVFALQDTHHKFSLGLSTVLECLAIAEANNYLPELPAEWWSKIRQY